MIFLRNLILFIFSFLLSNKLIKMFLLRLKEKFIDIPNSRSMHEIPTPSGVGIVFVFITITSSIICLLINGYSYKYIIPVLSIPLVLVGIFDDIYKVSPVLRYFFHILTSSSILIASKFFILYNFQENYLNYLFFILITFVFTAIINFINFMDGIDGIIGGSLFISILTCCIFFKISNPYILLLGSLAAFLTWNWHPAKIFMGDTGSLSLGGSLAAIAIIVKHEIVLAIIGGLFVLETVSVIIQVISFKLTGKRIFKMAPIHHHFEKKGWAESTIVIRFWIIAIILALVGLATLKLR